MQQEKSIPDRSEDATALSWQCLITVNDNGEGILPEVQDKIFCTVLHHQAFRFGHRAQFMQTSDEPAWGISQFAVYLGKGVYCCYLDKWERYIQK